MPHAFAPAIVELKRLEAALAVATYGAVFGKTPNARHVHTSNAFKLNEQVETTLTKIYQEAGQVSEFMRGPAQGLLETVNGLTQIVEQSGPQMPG